MRHFIGYVMAILMTVFSCGCSRLTNTSSNVATAGSDDVIVLRAGNNMAEDNQWNVNLAYWATLVNEATDGRVEIQIYPDSQLGDDPELAEMVRNGNVDIQITSGAVVGRWFKPMGITEMPYLFESLEHVSDCIYGKPGQYMKEGAAEHGFMIMDFWIRANRQILSTTPIYSLKDFQDMKIRVPATDIAVDSMAALGADPAPIAYSEAYTALQQGVVTAVENPLVSMYTMRFHEICNCLAITNHIGSFSVVLFSPHTWEQLPADIQDILAATLGTVTKSNNEITFREDKIYIDKIAEELGDKFIITYPGYEEWKNVGVSAHEELIESAKAEELYAMIKALA